MLKSFPAFALLMIAGPALLACSDLQAETVEAPATINVSARDFRCIQDMSPVRGFFVDSLNDNLGGTLAVARSDTGGKYPVGSLVQLVPTEAMVKRETGFDPATNDWEFLELDVSKEGTSIRVRGSADVVNRFGGNCLECHQEAEPQWDLICENNHGCDPIPLTPDMISAIQKTDPRCSAVPLTEQEKEALQMLKASMG